MIPIIISYIYYPKVLLTQESLDLHITIKVWLLQAAFPCSSYVIDARGRKTEEVYDVHLLVHLNLLRLSLEVWGVCVGDRSVRKRKKKIMKM